MSRVSASSWCLRAEAPTSCRVAAARPQTLAPVVGIAFSWLLSLRRQALILLARHVAFPARPNVRAKRETTVGRQARAGENVPRTARPGLVACRWRSA